MSKGFYDYLADIRPGEWLEYGVVLVVTMFIITRVVRPTWMQLVALGVGLILVFYRSDRRRSTTHRAFTELEYRLKELYPNLVALEEIALRKGIVIKEPFQGACIGNFTVMAPSKTRYLDLVVESEKTSILFTARCGKMQIANFRKSPIIVS